MQSSRGQDNPRSVTTLRTTYKIESGPPAMSWDDYEEFLANEWKGLLNSKSPPTEAQVQTFLELYPCLVPGAFSISAPSGHGPYLGSLITQPRLNGNSTRIPDFLWLASDSATFNPVFIEIESPSKRWFREDKCQRVQLTQAVGQLSEWVEWFRQEGHPAKFFDDFSIPGWLRSDRIFEPQLLLIYGRREEFLKRPELTQKRSRFSDLNHGSMTFDRLASDYNCRNFVTAKVRDGRYEVIAVPPTLTVGPNFSERWLVLNGVEEAIMQNDMIKSDRKEFLCERLQYWRNWRSGGDLGIVNGNDIE